MQLNCWGNSSYIYLLYFLRALGEYRGLRTVHHWSSWNMRLFPYFLVPLRFFRSILLHLLWSIPGTMNSYHFDLSSRLMPSPVLCAVSECIRSGKKSKIIGFEGKGGNYQNSVCLGYSDYSGYWPFEVRPWSFSQEYFQPSQWVRFYWKWGKSAHRNWFKIIQMFSNGPRNLSVLSGYKVPLLVWRRQVSFWSFSFPWPD